MTLPERRPLFWIASSRRDLKATPVAVQKKFGTALLDVQYGDTPADAKPLKGFGGAGVLEITEEYHRDAFRAVYTVTLASGVYVLHLFQEEVEARDRHAQAGHRSGEEALPARP